MTSRNLLPFVLVTVCGIATSKYCGQQSEQRERLKVLRLLYIGSHARRTANRARREAISIRAVSQSWSSLNMRLNIRNVAHFNSTRPVQRLSRTRLYNSKTNSLYLTQSLSPHSSRNSLYRRTEAFLAGLEVLSEHKSALT
jgi:hypothetical protein